jgi:hypothetical protein
MAYGNQNNFEGGKEEKLLTGESLRKSSNISGKDRDIRFERRSDGTFQQFVNGSKGQLFMESQMQEGLKMKQAADAALEQAEANFNETYKPSENKQDYESDILQRGIDQFTAPEATPETPQAGGLPSGFAEETLDVVNDDNTAGQRVFLTKAV